ncbi:hypothetical protein [Phaeobacter sp. HF9A]|uniref:hypothetical protein n=1 Tax=Phaeobacter sp. HF9A TaxID=2721561 RepID=UPI0020CA93CF|nr:hypothetical protein [Phaeobacter sp. HF9A]
MDHHQGAHLLHMIGADYDIWRSKLDWRCDSRGFTGPLTERVQAALAQPNPDVPLRALFARLHCATQDLLSRLEAHDLLLVLRINLPALVTEFFGVSLDDLP